MVPEDVKMRESVMVSRKSGATAEHEWIPRRPVPEPNDWFETAWADYREDRIYEK